MPTDPNIILAAGANVPVIAPFQQYLSLRDMMDERRYKRAQLERLRLQTEQEQQELADEQAFRAAAAGFTEKTPLSEFARYGKRGLETAAAYRTAQTAGLTREKTQQEIEENTRKAAADIAEKQARDLIGFRKLKPERRDAAYRALNAKWGTLGWPTDPDDIPPTDDEIDQMIASVGLSKDVLEERTKEQAYTYAQTEEQRKIAAEARAVAEERRKVAKEPHELRRLELEAKGTPGVHITYPPGVLTEKLKLATAAAPVHPTAAQIFPKSPEVVKAELEQKKAEAKIQAEAAGEKPMSAEAAKVHAVAVTLIPELKQLREAIRTGGRKAIAGILSGTDTNLVRLAENAADKVGRLRSGGAVNPTEEQRFMGQIARKMDLVTGDTSAALDAIDRVMGEADTVVKSMTRKPPPAGGAGAGGTSKKSDPLGIR